MGMRTPLEDFVKTTLASLPGFWQKLLYLGDLRANREQYDHWGMTRRYGDQVSNSAMGAAHTEVFIRILRTPLRTLLSDIKASAEPQGRTLREYLDHLWSSREQVVPPDPGGGSKQHFDLTLRTMESLVKAQGEENRKDE
jgi:hypothetical protein